MKIISLLLFFLLLSCQNEKAYTITEDMKHADTIIDEKELAFDTEEECYDIIEEKDSAASEFSDSLSETSDEMIDAAETELTDSEIQDVQVKNKNISAFKPEKGKHAGSPRIAAGNPHQLFILFAQWTEEDQSDIFIISSEDDGKTFNTPKKVNKSKDIHSPEMLLADDGSVHAVWAEKNSKIMHAFKYPDGDSFTDPVAVNDSDPAFSVDEPHIAIIQSKIHVVYREWNETKHMIRYARSDDKGLSFLKSIRIDGGPDSLVRKQPEIAVSADGIIFAVWVDYKEPEGFSSKFPEILFARSPDGGNTFGAGKILNDDAFDKDFDHENPQITVSAQGNVFVFWADSRNGKYDIYSALSYDKGFYFEKNVKVNSSDGEANPFAPAGSFDSTGDVFIVWPHFQEKDKNICEIYSSVSKTGGGIFNPFKIVTDPQTKALPEIRMSASKTDKAYIVFVDQRNGTDEIYIDIEGNL
jgi:hypothetical protein